jgi:hypothetical protein
MNLAVLAMFLILMCGVVPLGYAEDDSERDDSERDDSERDDSEREENEREGNEREGSESQIGESKEENVLGSLGIGEREDEEIEDEKNEENEDSPSSGPVLYVVIGAIIIAIGYTAFRILRKKH